MPLCWALLAVTVSLAAGAAPVPPPGYIGPPMDYNCTTYGSVYGSAYPYTADAFNCQDKLSRTACRELFSSRSQSLRQDVITKAGDLGPIYPECFSVISKANGVASYSQNIKALALENCPNFCGFCCQAPKTAGK